MADEKPADEKPADEKTADKNPDDEKPAESPRVGLLAQYVKDISFENPNAPQSLTATGTPEIEVSVNTSTRRMDPERYETIIKIEITARRETATMFMLEVSYGGLFALENVPEEQLAPICMIECPRQLFPFVRRVVSDATRDGGFPPLMLDPVDFAALYRAELEKRQAASASDD